MRLLSGLIVVTLSACGKPPEPPSTAALRGAGSAAPDAAPPPADQVLPGDGTCLWYGIELPADGGALQRCQLNTARVRHTGLTRDQARGLYVERLMAAAYEPLDVKAHLQLRRADRTVEVTSFDSADGSVVDVVLLLR